jgi:hypothetical protein
MSKRPTDAEFLVLVRGGALRMRAAAAGLLKQVPNRKREYYRQQLVRLKEFTHWADACPTRLQRAAKLERAYMVAVIIYNEMVDSCQRSKDGRKADHPAEKRREIEDLLADPLAKQLWIATKAGVSERYVRKVKALKQERT